MIFEGKTKLCKINCGFCGNCRFQEPGRMTLPPPPCWNVAVCQNVFPCGPVLGRIPWLEPDSGHELAFEKGLNSIFQQERKDGVGANGSIGGLENVILWDPDLRKLC
ncbi:hypothetical protein NC652_026836 [Populus alba x Populus x berolinensis]|nr:hypothetical protein NC652_026836 [Populus alba x Populus x berolinensis]